MEIEFEKQFKLPEGEGYESLCKNNKGESIRIIGWPALPFPGESEIEEDCLKQNLELATAFINEIAKLKFVSDILFRNLKKINFERPVRSQLGRYKPENKLIEISNRYSLSLPKRFFPLFIHELGHPLVQDLIPKVSLKEWPKGEFLANMVGVELVGLDNYKKLMAYPLEHPEEFPLLGFPGESRFVRRIEYVTKNYPYLCSQVPNWPPFTLNDEERKKLWKICQEAL